MSSSPRTDGGVIVDIGTGDGLFAYRCARQHPDRFYIGIDASAGALTKISEKAHRKPAKGGAPNLLFVHAAVEELPSELNGVADEVHVHFPWGSLLRAVALGDEAVLRNLRRICTAGAWLEVILGIDPERDRSEIERLGLDLLSAEFVETILKSRYEAAGFEVLEAGVLPGSDRPEIQTSWAQRLGGSGRRWLIYLIARAV
jgi:16S rRNA (adenine(1408)-N(1))-methyltransferase